MITVREFRNIIEQCPKNFFIRLKKWEHCTEEELQHRSYPMPNRVSVKITSISQDYNEFGTNTYKFIFKDDFDNDLEGTSQEIFDIFCKNLSDYDLLSFKLQVGTEMIPLNVEAGDIGYSDKIMNIEFEENK